MQSNEALKVWPANVRRHSKHCFLITSEAGDRRRDQDAVSRRYVSPTSAVAWHRRRPGTSERRPDIRSQTMQRARRWCGYRGGARCIRLVYDRRLCSSCIGAVPYMSPRHRPSLAVSSCCCSSGNSNHAAGSRSDGQFLTETDSNTIR